MSVASGIVSKLMEEKAEREKADAERVAKAKEKK
jgi:hypothetical protein